MRVRVICPAPPGSLYGNRVTARRWARILRELGHRVTVATDYQEEPCDALIALHARKSADSVLAFRDLHPQRPCIVALTGTDVYQDIRTDRRARLVLELATHLAVLQPLAIEELAEHQRAKATVIYQSAEKTTGPIKKREDVFDVCVVGHLREVKDPFRTAMAARRLPAASKVRVLHAGEAMDEAMARRAQSEEKRNRRYKWLGGIPRHIARRLVASSRVLVLSSRMEGGANVISEAVVDGVPVVVSRIAGSVGLLGADYPGYFGVGDTRALSQLLERVESDRRFRGRLEAWCARVAPLFRPERERAAWKRLLR
ncbi:MAG: selenoneine biosynthesis selenosugar synthase SenB [Bryobacteraceae bacterium]